MQKITDPIRALIFHYSPEAVFVLTSVNGIIAACQELAPHMTSKLLLPRVRTVLQELQWDLTHISYLACAQGPGSFTTIRSLIVTSNALAWGASLPLLGYNALSLLAESAHQPPYTITYALADAFCGMVHSARFPSHSSSELSKTCSYEIFFKQIEQELASSVSPKIHIIGSGLTPRTSQINLLEHAYLTYSPEITHADPSFVARKLHQQWLDNPQGVAQLTPLYNQTST